MSYFSGVKTGDKVWDFNYGWGIISNINAKKNYPIEVKFSDNLYETYLMDGKKYINVNQTLFWDEIKFKIPKKHKIELNKGNFKINLYDNDVYELDTFVAKDLINTATNGLTRNDKETANNALKQIKKFTRLLALRDQECPDSRGYEFEHKVGNDKNYYIYFYNCDKKWEVDKNPNCEHIQVYFKTEADAQKVCDILNSGRFDLEGE